MSAQLTKQQKISLAQTSLGQSSSYFSEGVYVDPEIVADLQVYRQGAVYKMFSYKSSTQAHDSGHISFYFDATMAFSYPSTRPANESIKALSQRLCEAHPSISSYEGIFGGLPHLNGLRISVADILEQLYLTGSIAGVQQVYSPDVSEDQIKEAIAYAQDFLESALSSSP